MVFLVSFVYLVYPENFHKYGKKKQIEDNNFNANIEECQTASLLLQE